MPSRCTFLEPTDLGFCSTGALVSRQSQWVPGIDSGYSGKQPQTAAVGRLSDHGASPESFQGSSASLECPTRLGPDSRATTQSFHSDRTPASIALQGYKSLRKAGFGWIWGVLHQRCCTEPTFQHQPCHPNGTPPSLPKMRDV